MSQLPRKDGLSVAAAERYPPSGWNWATAYAQPSTGQPAVLVDYRGVRGRTTGLVLRSCLADLSREVQLHCEWDGSDVLAVIDIAATDLLFEQRQDRLRDMTARRPWLRWAEPVVVRRPGHVPLVRQYMLARGYPGLWLRQGRTVYRGGPDYRWAVCPAFLADDFLVVDAKPAGGACLVICEIAGGEEFEAVAAGCPDLEAACLWIGRMVRVHYQRLVDGCPALAVATNFHGGDDAADENVGG